MRQRYFYDKRFGLPCTTVTERLCVTQSDDIELLAILPYQMKLCTVTPSLDTMPSIPFGAVERI
jgi:hypothetical protein